MKQLENDILRVRDDSERIERETEQLRQDNARLKAMNARGRALLSCIDQHCFPPESSSIPPMPTEPGCKPSLP